LSALPPEPDNPYTTDTGEIVWDTGGLLQVNAGSFIGFTGFLDDFPDHTAGALTLKSASGFATLTWVSLTENDLAYAEKSLFTLSTTLQNTNMTWDGFNTVHNQWGTAPTQMRPVSVSLGLMIYADSIRLYTLDTSGRESGTIRVLMPVAGNHFEIVLDQFEDETVWWGLEKFGSGIPERIDSDGPEIPAVPQLGRNYPNPFNSDTVIPYALAQNMHVRILIFNLKGERIRTLVDDEERAGRYLIHWDGKTERGQDAVSGLYVIEMQSHAFRARQKVVRVN
jgi:hypothetical protein